MITKEDVPALDSYCWHHDGPENGGWGCVQCYIEDNLIQFCAAVRRWVRSNELPISITHAEDPRIPDDGWTIDVLNEQVLYAGREAPLGSSGYLRKRDGSPNIFMSVEQAVQAIKQAIREEM